MHFVLHCFIYLLVSNAILFIDHLCVISERWPVEMALLSATHSGQWLSVLAEVAAPALCQKLATVNVLHSVVKPIQIDLCMLMSLTTLPHGLHLDAHACRHNCTLEWRLQLPASVVNHTVLTNRLSNNHLSTYLATCTPCLKKLCKFVFVRTSSNLHQFW